MRRRPCARPATRGPSSSCRSSLFRRASPWWLPSTAILILLAQALEHFAELSAHGQVERLTSVSERLLSAHQPEIPSLCNMIGRPPSAFAAAADLHFRHLLEFRGEHV